MLIAFGITTDENAHSKYVILITFPRH